MGNNYIKFLGTAGARFVMARQLRSSAGVFLQLEGRQIVLDPGPGTLVRCAKSKPPIDVTALEAIILTHNHIDHSNDVNVLIDAMTAGGLNKRGVLFAPEECLHGEHAVVLKYLRGFLDDIVILKAKHEYRLGDVTFSTSIRHQHPAETYGVQFDVAGRKLSFLVDTKYFPGLVESYQHSDVLVINVVRYMPKSDDVMHLSIAEVKEVIAAIKPSKTILTHFGMTMLKAKPWVVAEQLTQELGVEVVAASDGLTVEI